MNESVKADILSVLSQAGKLLEENKTFGLKQLSDHTIHNASIFQDQDSLSLAVVIYSLSKTLERSGDFRPDLPAGLLKEASYHLSAGDTDSYRRIIASLFQLIAKQDNRLQLFIEEVSRQAHIKKGSKVYDHGISAAQASELLGISQWELLGYIGKTRIHEELPTDVRKRLEAARVLFR